MKPITRELGALREQITFDQVDAAVGVIERDMINEFRIKAYFTKGEASDNKYMVMHLIEVIIDEYYYADMLVLQRTIECDRNIFISNFILKYNYEVELIRQIAISKLFKEFMESKDKQ